MMHLNEARRTWKHFLPIVVGVVALAGTAAADESEADRPGTFAWSAELVTFDEDAKMITVKSLVVGNEMKDWSDFNKGDHVILTWSGINIASGVRYVSHDEADPDSARLAMPVEFVSVEKDGRYVTYRVAVPAGEWPRIKTLAPGQWVTATAPRETSVDGLAVTSIRPYSEVG